MMKTIEEYKREILYPGRLHRKFARRIFRRFGGSFFLYTCFPKSASQYLAAMISNVFENDLKVIKAKSGPGLGHTFISQDELIRNLNYRKNLLLYGHIPYIHSNIEILERRFRIQRVIITIRPLPDIVVSYKEHVDRLGHGPLDYHVHDLPECHPEWHILGDEKKYDFIIQFVIPWYVRFVTGWLEASKSIPVDFITFEEHTLFPRDCLSNISAFLNLHLNAASIEKLKTIHMTPTTNFNKGISGRGGQLLKQTQLDRINEIVSLCGEMFHNSFLGKYLLHGYEGQQTEPHEVIGLKRRSQHSFSDISSDIQGTGLAVNTAPVLLKLST
jgi:hypothetical protein